MPAEGPPPQAAAVLRREERWEGIATRAIRPASRICLAPPALLPALGLVARAAHASLVLLDDERPWHAGDGVHRALLTGSDGAQLRIVAPVASVRPGIPLHRVRLRPDGGWTARAMRSVERAFADTPCFEHLRCDLARALFAPHARLVDLQLALLRLVLRQFGLAAEVDLASSRADTRQAVAPQRIHGHTKLSLTSALAALVRHGPDARHFVPAEPDFPCSWTVYGTHSGGGGARPHRLRLPARGLPQVVG